MPFVPKHELDWLAALAERVAATARDDPGYHVSMEDADHLRTLAAGLTGYQGDGRLTPRLIRIRLYADPRGEPEADSEAGALAGAPGTWQVSGLTETALAVAQTATAYHRGDEISGLDREALMGRINGLRVTLSRNGGEGTWRIPYTVNGKEWVARVDIKSL